MILAVQQFKPSSHWLSKSKSQWHKLQQYLILPVSQESADCVLERAPVLALVTIKHYILYWKEVQDHVVAKPQRISEPKNGHIRSGTQRISAFETPENEEFQNGRD